MSSTNDQPDSCGSLSPENALQVVVRAGKTFVCSACGTLVEIPADVVGQWVLASESSPTNASDLPDAPSEVPDHVETAPQGNPATETSFKTTSTATTAPPKKRPPRPLRPRAPKPECFVGQVIEGLCVPSGRKLHHAMGWVSFQLKVLDRQDSETKRLRKLLKRQPTAQAPSAPPRGPTETITPQQPPGSSTDTNSSQAHKDNGRAPPPDDQHQRGPP